MSQTNPPTDDNGLDEPPEEFQEFDERAFARRTRRHGGPALVKLVDGIPVFDLDDAVSLYKTVFPVSKVVLLVVLLALKDRASEARFETEKTESEGQIIRMFCTVDNEEYELIPPPPQLAEHIIREVRSLGRPPSLRRDFADFLRHVARKLDPHTREAQESLFQIQGGDERVKVCVTSTVSETGDRVLLGFAAFSEALSGKAQAAMMEIFDERKGERPANGDSGDVESGEGTET